MSKDIQKLSLEIINAVSGKIGIEYFQELVIVLGSKLNLDYVSIAELSGENGREATTRAVYGKGVLLENFTYSLKGTPCDDVRKRGVCCFPNQIQKIFPDDHLLQEMNVESYIGASLIDSNGESMGVLMILNEMPLEQEKEITGIMHLVVARTEVELERVRVDEALRQALEDTRRVKEELQHREAELLCHIRNTPLGCISWDPDFRCVAWNASAENIFGYTQREVVGKKIAEKIVPQEIMPQIKVVFDRLLQRKGGGQNTNRNLTKYGHEIVCDWYNTPIINRSGEVIGITSLVMDISDSIRHKEQLERAKEAADNANKFKTNFMANLSHEFRTPLNAIIGYSEIMREELFGPIKNNKYRQHAQNIHSSGLHLLDMVNDILDISTLETGSRKLQIEDVDCDATVIQVVDELKGLAGAKDILLMMSLKQEVKNSSDQNNKPLIEAERKCVQQILYNVISNAIKYTRPRGRINVSTEYHETFMKLTVTDDGIGIPQDKIPQIVSPFVQIESNAYLAKEGGVGLGLAIVKSLVEHHRGYLEINSALGKGTQVSIYLPMKHDGKHIRVETLGAQEPHSVLG